MAGTISSLAPTVFSLSPPLLASTSLDRFFCLYSTYEPQNNGRKGEVLAKTWVKSAAGCVAWDGRLPAPGNGATDGNEDDEYDVWAGMENVGEGGDNLNIGSGSDDEDEERSLANNKKKKVR
jgi:ribosome biogenesis protein NSA1